MPASGGLPARVRKVLRPGAASDRLSKQCRRLRWLSDHGIRAATVYAEDPAGRWAEQEYVEGRTLADSPRPLTEEQEAGLQAIEAWERRGGRYIGDLNRRNLVWSGEEWVVIDCGSIRYVDDLADRQARRRWMRHIPRRTHPVCSGVGCRRGSCRGCVYRTPEEEGLRREAEVLRRNGRWEEAARLLLEAGYLP